MITGRFNFIEVPEVPEGQPIKAEVEWYGFNPEFSIWNPLDPAWKSFLIAESPGLFRLKLDDTNEIQRDFTRKRTFTLGTMPDREIAISFFLFAHHETGYDWDWGEYAAWMDGFATDVIHLVAEYRFISPGAAPPPAPPPGGLQTLEVDITPPAGGHVTTSPAPVAGSNYWRDGDRGQFQYGTSVQVTAHAHAGHQFEKWSDEITGGVSYNNTAQVAGVMDEHRAVKAHFREIEEVIPGPSPPPTPPPTPTLTPTEYQCQYCGQYFASQAELDEHIRAIHPDKPTPVPPTPSWLVPALIAGAALLMLVPTKRAR